MAGREGGRAVIAETRPFRADPGAGDRALPDRRAAIWRAAARNRALMLRAAGPAAVAQLVLVAVGLPVPRCMLYVTSDFSVLNVCGELAFGEAAALQDLRRVGKPRRLDGAVGPHPRRSSARRRRLRRQSAARAQVARARRPGSVAAPSCSSSSRPPIPSCASILRPSKAMASIRSCRIPRSPSIRRFSMRAMSGSRSPSPSPLPR